MQDRYQSQHSERKESFLEKLHLGFNYFHQVKFPPTQKYSQVRMNRSFRTSRHQRLTSEINTQSTQMQKSLTKNKDRLARLKTQINQTRQKQFNEYIKKTNYYQQLLDLNQNKKKRLATLNTKVGEVIKKNISEYNRKLYVYEAHFISIKIDDWKPQSREGHTCIPYKDMIIMIGGHCSSPFSKLNFYSIWQNKWVKQIQNPSARSYHTSIYYKNRYIINFGGMGVYSAARKHRECFNSINLIDLRHMTSKVIKMQNEHIIEERRSHSAIIMGKHMIVFGGMNSQKQYLKDLVALDLKEFRWYHKQYKIEGLELASFFTHGLAKHKTFSNFKPRKAYPLYSPDYQQNEGIYIFGGYNQEGQDNILLKITFNKYIPFIRKVQYKGVPPSSIDPLIEKFNENTVAIVSGDQYDRNIFIYQIKEQKFQKIEKYTGKLSLGGLGSAMVNHNNNFYIFYGLHREGYSASIQCFTMTETMTERMKSRKKKRAENQWKLQLTKQAEQSQFSQSSSQSANNLLKLNIYV